MAEETVKATPPVREIASPEYLKAVADMQEFAKRAESAAERNEKAAQLMADVEKAREKNRVVQTSVQAAPAEFDSLADLVNTPPEKLGDEWAREVHKTFWEIKNVDGIFRLGASQGRISYDSPKKLKLGRKMDRLMSQKSASWNIQTDTDGGGSVGSQDWVSVLYTTQIADFYNLPAKLATVFQRVEMPQGQGSVRIPVAADANAVTIVTEVTAAQSAVLTATTGPETDFITLTSVKHRAGTLMSWEFTEDAVVNAMGYAQAAIRKQLSLALDSCLISGQTLALATLDTNNGPVPANGYGNALRAYTHVTAPVTVPVGGLTAGGAPLDSGMIATMRMNMGKYGVVPTECVIVVSPKGYLGLVADADQNVVTVEKYGNAATILTGELGRCFGVPIICSDQYPENLGADGDATVTGLVTSALIANITRWYLGIKRDIEVRIVPNPAMDQIGVYGFMRTAFGFAPTIPASQATDRHVVEIINVGF